MLESHANPTHRLEQLLQRELRDECPIENLTVRPIADGVCLQGTVEGGYDRSRIATLIKEIAKVERVIDQVVSQRS